MKVGRDSVLVYKALEESIVLVITIPFDLSSLLLQCLLHLLQFDRIVTHRAMWLRRR